VAPTTATPSRSHWYENAPRPSASAMLLVSALSVWFSVCVPAILTAPVGSWLGVTLKARRPRASASVPTPTHVNRTRSAVAATDGARWSPTVSALAANAAPSGVPVASTWRAWIPQPAPLGSTDASQATMKPPAGKADTEGRPTVGPAGGSTLNAPPMLANPVAMSKRRARIEVAGASPSCQTTSPVPSAATASDGRIVVSLVAATTRSPASSTEVPRGVSEPAPYRRNQMPRPSVKPCEPSKATANEPSFSTATSG